MDEQYLVDVDKQPIRNAIFRTLAGLICAVSLFPFWSDGVRAYEAGWAHFDVSSGLSTLFIVPIFIVMGLFAIGGYGALDKPHHALDNGLQRLLDPNYKADVSSSHLGQQVDCPRRKKIQETVLRRKGAEALAVKAAPKSFKNQLGGSKQIGSAKASLLLLN